MTLMSLGTTTRVMMFVSLFLMTIETAYDYQRSNEYWSERKALIRNCKDIQRQRTSPSGLYTIYPYDFSPDHPVKVFCDHETDGGGWTVIQWRDDIVPREDFNRTWMEYALGFGNLRGEFWLGNKIIDALTSQALNEIRFDLVCFEEHTFWVKYKYFYVHGMESSYKLEVNGYSGNAGDSFLAQNGMHISAMDKNFIYDVQSCAKGFQGEWWSRSCDTLNLNGLYHKGKYKSFEDGVSWLSATRYYYSMKKTEKKIPPYYWGLRLSPNSHFVDSRDYGKNRKKERMNYEEKNIIVNTEDLEEVT